MRVINSIRSLYGGTAAEVVVTYRQLIDRPLFRPEDLRGGISMMKIYEGKNDVAFLIKQKKGTELRRHSNDCIQRTFLINGFAEDTVNKRRMVAGQSTSIGRDVPHGFYAYEDTVYIVVFEKFT